MMPVGTTEMNRGSGKVLKCSIPPGVTGKDRQRPARLRGQPERHQEQPGRHRSSTGDHAELRKRTSCRRCPGECRPSPGLRLGITGDYRG
ncbi:hypothetical protein DPMN_033521 [Dreissena polymorpha]|uniref:Uncharacterized protein n=1 Tax=Dreissena polymorpha TaxID=45954 RepID=A0A9D4M6S1_DREPO|nr:hypothetical protein DPMN_033521 [Dreissena polymorpha]